MTILSIRIVILRLFNPKHAPYKIGLQLHGSLISEKTRIVFSTKKKQMSPPQTHPLPFGGMEKWQIKFHPEKFRSFTSVPKNDIGDTTYTGSMVTPLKL